MTPDDRLRDGQSESCSREFLFGVQPFKDAKQTGGRGWIEASPVIANANRLAAADLGFTHFDNSPGLLGSEIHGVLQQVVQGLFQKPAVCANHRQRCDPPFYIAVLSLRPKLVNYFIHQVTQIYLDSPGFREFGPRQFQEFLHQILHQTDLATDLGREFGTFVRQNTGTLQHQVEKHPGATDWSAQFVRHGAGHGSERGIRFDNPSGFLPNTLVQYLGVPAEFVVEQRVLIGHRQLARKRQCHRGVLLQELRSAEFIDKPQPAVGPGRSAHRDCQGGLAGTPGARPREAPGRSFIESGRGDLRPTAFSAYAYSCGACSYNFASCSRVAFYKPCRIAFITQFAAGLHQSGEAKHREPELLGFSGELIG